MSNMYKQIFVREVRAAFSAVIIKIFPKSSFLFFPSVLQRRNAAAKREKKTVRRLCHTVFVSVFDSGGIRLFSRRYYGGRRV